MAAAASSGGREPAGMSPTCRLLALCANVAAARSRLLLWEFRRWASLLQTGGGGKELQAAVHACAAELEAVETRLGGAYIDHKQVGVWRQPPEQFAVTLQQIGRCAAPSDCCHRTTGRCACICLKPLCCCAGYSGRGDGAAAIHGWHLVGGSTAAHRPAPCGTGPDPHAGSGAGKRASCFPIDRDTYGCFLQLCHWEGCAFHSIALLCCAFSRFYPAACHNARCRWRG